MVDKKRMVSRWGLLSLLVLQVMAEPDPQLGARGWDVDRLIRARNPNAPGWTSTTSRSRTWQTLRSITYNPLLEEGSVGSASVEEASLVKSFKPTPKTPQSSATRFSVGVIALILPFMLLNVPHTL
jgi:hypothetical protein